MTPLNDEKARLRAQAKAVRAAAFAAMGRAAAQRLAEQAGLLGAGPRDVVAGYHPLPEEIDPLPLLARLHEAGSGLALPCVAAWAKPLLFRAWKPGDALQPGRHGTREPPPASPAVSPALLLVPLLAFDRQGHRLGYGGGFYDRTLQALRALGRVRAIGLAFAGQEVEAIPAEPFDQKLDAVLTEAGFLSFEG
jgi:5-formyltetrahydrofolate cyclo-ligase